MFPHSQHHRRATLLKALLLYVILASLLLWLQPPPILFELSQDKTSSPFTSTSEPALIRLLPKDEKNDSILNYVIDRIDLPSGTRQQITFDSDSQTASSKREYRHSMDGSLLVLHDYDLDSVSVWDGHTGNLRFIKKCEPTSEAPNCEMMACSPDGTRIALIPVGNPKAIDIFDARTGQTLGRVLRNGSNPIYRLRFSLDGKSLLCAHRNWETMPDRDVLTGCTIELFDTSTMTAVHRSTTLPKLEVCPANDGFWISQWDRSNEKITLSYLDASSGKQTILAPHLSRRLSGFPHILSDKLGHLYLIQDRLKKLDDWQHRWRICIIGWLNQLGFNWNITQIEVRHISPDGQRILQEQTFSANYAEITPDGHYLVLLSELKDIIRATIYRYPTTFNWSHSLLWPTLPTFLYLLVKRRTLFNTQYVGAQRGLAGLAGTKQCG